MRKNRWNKTVVIAMVLCLLMGLGVIVQPGTASAAAPALGLVEVTSQGAISLAFDLAIASPDTIGVEQFAVSVDSLSVAVTSVVTTSTIGKIKLQLATPIIGGQVVKVVYTKGSEVNKQIRAASDNTAVESFGPRDATNPLPKPAPALAPDSTNNIVGQAVDITYAGNATWQAAITGITVNGTALSSGQYTVTADSINIAASAFSAAGNYPIAVKATGYVDAAVNQPMQGQPAVFTIAGNVVAGKSYTMTQLKNMQSTTATYTTSKGDVSCTGVALADLMTALNATGDSVMVQINTTDAATYPVSPDTLAGIFDPAKRYLLTYEVNSQPITTDTTTIRVYWSGKLIKNVTGITLTGPSPAVFSIAGNAVAAKSYTMTELKNMQSTTGTYTTSKGDVSCTGVALADMMAALSITGDSLMVQINTTDAATYPVSPDTLAGIFDPTKSYLLTYEVNGQPITTDTTTIRVYWSGKLIKNVTGITITANNVVKPVYTISPVADTAYNTGKTPAGINTMTVKAGNSGFKYFAVNITPVTAHVGREVVVFTHLRNGNQLGINATKADFDQVNIAQAGFNVQAGDVVKAYIVDDLTNSVNVNPVVFQ